VQAGIGRPVNAGVRWISGAMRWVRSVARALIGGSGGIAEVMNK
jgi:hypothetical protein